MCNSQQPLYWLPLPWLACWVAGAAIASVSRAAQMNGSSMPRSCETRLPNLPTLGSPLLRESVRRLRLNPCAPFARPKRELGQLHYLRG